MFYTDPELFSYIKTSANGFALGDVSIRIPDGMYWKAAPLGYLFGLSFANKPDREGDVHKDKEYWHLAFKEGDVGEMVKELVGLFPKAINPDPMERIAGYGLCDMFPMTAGGAMGTAMFYTHHEPWRCTPEDGDVWMIGMHAAFNTAARDDEGAPLYFILEVYKNMEATEMLKYRQDPKPLLEMAPFSTVLAGISKISG